MSNQQCPEIQGFPLTQKTGTHEHKQQAQGNTGNDIRVGHGDVGQAQNHLAHFGLQAVDTHGGQRAECHGNGGGQQGNQNGIAQKTQQVFVPEQLSVLLQCKAFKLGQVLAGVERAYDQHCHGDIEEYENENGQNAVCLFHMTTPPSSSPPKRFMMPVQTNTRSISTKLSAAPRLGLSPCLNRRSIRSPMSTVSVPPSFWEI